ncbi:activating transcription factor 7-interacting protein 1 isoform X1 [Falco biarmicus]|uniref:activating transcription factor 7-interacting protein 1 isoform X1 n=1 Tax=Falco cherrug TaxID=345164 RepID=UPI00188690B9|nr:activating transcription factor 7-interacting protein 1 isoform X1 [Falco cherrug]XP_027664188.2 activating transcription factor 7-interacting protein 1 isoform X1 [Falco cherrug]XP_027664190.2 activating transcription factor 7-interacting protein 1 isoform X1 [Falco cherrug]XP_027664191.2 activating transcription factor 7-interacting protein 1 isoform X1 [Falco cherrug]XP_037245647.1 activating transcription factor 7-interacting protein 1 isoform X1 [Falco rusticolus]XP_037245648.1 activat
MDSADEPQKKVFKARKTMRVSDRQQLEAVYKVKEELLKTTEVKLVNGKHENGDSDLNSPLSNTDCMEDKREVNGLVDLCVNSEEGKTAYDENSEAKSPESRAGNIVNDMELKPLTLSAEKSALSPEQDKDTDTALACEAETGVLASNKDNFHEENTKDHLDQRESDSPSEGGSKSICVTSDPSEEKGETYDVTVNSNSSGEEKRTEVTVEDAVGEEAISSSIEADQEPKDKHDGTADLSETTVQKTVDEPSEGILDNADSMETDEIIPILEKLAPAEDELSCFSKSSLLPVDDTVPDLEEKMDNSLGSPSKQESNESLPKEAFLVLSDEEEPCDEKEECAEAILPNKSSLPEEVEEERRKDCEEYKEGEEAHGEGEKHTERSEVSRRKRSKSEDMDSVHSKRRRYMGEDYEAELQVKITARKDVDQKLQKVIQRLLEEKLTALQCAVFDKTLADLKTRIEKVECNKRHKTVLTELQAKIARLTKRFGAAREDLKKRQENSPNAPLSPGKAATDTANTNNVTYRHAGTVRQMLESKRNIGESTPGTSQAPVNAVPASTLAAPPAVASGHPKPQTPVTSTSSLTTVLPTANTATVVGTNQVPSGSTQSVSVSLQSLPVILHVPVAVSSQPQLLQGHTGTLVTNQQSGSVEFISVQSSSTVGSLTKTTMSLAPANPTKPNNSPSVPSPGIQRNSPGSAGPVSTTLAVQAVTTAHPVAQATRTSLPTVGTSGLYNATSSRAPLQMKIPLSAFNSTAPTEPPTITAPRVENQTSKPPTDTSANKRTAEGTTQQLKQEETSSENKEAVEAAQTNFNFPEDVLFGLEEEEEDAKSIKNTHKQTGWAANLLKQWLAKNGKDPSFELVPSGKVTGSDSGGVIDLTLDEEDDGSSQADSKKQNQTPVTGLSISTQPLAQPLQPNPVQQPGVPTSGPSQTTIHVLSTAVTTVNVTHRPVTQTATKLPIPRATANHQVVYTTLPAPPAQNPVRGAIMPSPGLRPVNPQTGGMTVRMPQTTAYVVNNGLTLGSGAPQLTVHHRPPQMHVEPPRPVHPAPLPDAPQPPRLPPEAANTSLPQKPQLKLARVQSQNGIVLSWSVMEVDRSCATVDSYHLYAYHEDPSATMPSQWKKIGEVKALPLPMACTLTQFVSGSKYYFAVRAKDIYGRFGPFCDPQSTDVISSQSS